MNDDNYRQYEKGTGYGNIIDETAPDNQKYDDLLTKDAYGDYNDEVATDNQKKDVQGDDKKMITLAGALKFLKSMFN